MKINFEDILSAAKAIDPVANNTPLIESSFLSKMSPNKFYLKLESVQPIGAFKIRGAVNAIKNLPSRTRGVTCASTGNHGRGVAFAAQKENIPAVIFMSNTVPQIKIESVRDLGAEVRIIDSSWDEVESECKSFAKMENYKELSPFDDPFVIAGQGTIGLELIEKIPDLNTVLIPMSGGGLASGVALAMKSKNPNIRIIGVSMENGAAMHQSLLAGYPVEVVESRTLADALVGGIGVENEYSFDMCKMLIDETVLVSEEEIYRALQTLFFEDRLVAEGSCVVGIAAFLSSKVKNLKGSTAAIITGRNIDMDIFFKIIAGLDIRLGEKMIKGQKYRAG